MGIWKTKAKRTKKRMAVFKRLCFLKRYGNVDSVRVRRRHTIDTQNHYLVDMETSESPQKAHQAWVSK